MEIRPFRVEIPQQSLDDLRNRLDRTRWTSDIPGEGPEYGTGLAWVQKLAGYWSRARPSCRDDKKERIK